MALVPHIYLDAGLTDQFDDATDTLPAAAINGSFDQRNFYFGSPDPAIKIQAASAPGTDPLQIGIVDAAAGSGVEATHLKLAVSQAALTGAPAGGTLTIGETINGGVVNAIPIWYQWDNSTGSGTSTEISFSVTERVEVAI
jgi:hypothetical protein